jgi:CysZ protein
MKDVLTSIPEAFRYLFKDPVNFILFLIPGLLAVVIYIVAGTYALENGMALTKVVINKYILSQNANMFMYYFVSGLMAFLLFMLVSWTFVLMIGILAAPFNSVISSRIERKIRGDLPSNNKSQGFQEVMAGFARTLFNEFKKLTVIIIATVMAMGLNFFPVLFPLALVLLTLIMSAQFLDYSWSRHDLSAGACLKDIIGYFFGNVFAGAIFLLLISVPLINVLVPAYATSFYTVLWTKRQQQRH